MITYSFTPTDMYTQFLLLFSIIELGPNVKWSNGPTLHDITDYSVNI